MTKYEVHVSDIKAFLACRRKWDWTSLLRDGLEPRVPYMPFFTGRAIHWALQQYYEYGVEPLDTIPVFLEHEMKEAGDMWSSEQELVREQVDMITGMLDHYYLWATRSRGPFHDENLEFISLETEFEVPIPTPTGRASPRVYLAGRFDGIVRRKDNGTYWLWEVKTARSIEGLQRTLDNDMQNGVYLYAAQQILGKPISGVLYNIMRKKIPTDPRVLQNGMLSVNKNIDTTPHHFARFAMLHHDDQDDPSQYVVDNYGEMLTYLMHNGKDFFRRVPIRRTQGEIDALMQDVHYISLEMTRPTVYIYPHPHWANCNFCKFKTPCLIKNDGGDYETILRQEFVPRTPWDSLKGEEFNEED